MALSPKCRLVACFVLAMGLGLAACLPAASPSFDAVTGLTLTEKDAGRFQLAWDPIYRDDLMGYSVWLRKPGEREFTRLSVPVRVGKEVHKLPMTSDASLVLALGKTRRDIEVAVVAEYQDGVAPRSASVFTHSALPAAGQGAASSIPVPDVKAVRGKAATDKDSLIAKASDDDVDVADRKPQRLLDQDEPLLTPYGSWRSELDLGFDYKRSIRSGTATYAQLGYSVANAPSSQSVQWARIDTRTIFSVPLTLRWGFLPGFEAWAQGNYDIERVFIDSYKIGSETLGHVAYFGQAHGQKYAVTEPNSAALGDSKVGVRVTPFGQLPLWIGAFAQLPTGQSRFRSFLDWEEGRGDAAGTGIGVTRMTFQAAFGDPGQRKGPSFQASFSPGVTERVTAFWNANLLDHVFIRGDETVVGGAYTFPWAIDSHKGALLLGCQVRSIGAARWTATGVDMTQYYAADDLGAVIAHTDARFVRDDQIEVSLQAIQSVGRGLRTGGRLAYISGVQGDAFSVSGQFFY